MSTDMSVVSLISNASLIVQLVMLLLLAASVMSWALIIKQWKSLKAYKEEANTFEAKFWSGGDLANLYKKVEYEGNPFGLSSIFKAGFTEFARLQERPGMPKETVLDGTRRAMRVAAGRELDVIEHNLPFLATVGSTSPYIGLFGTVWGIMNSFRSLGAMQQATIATVAPGIAEALIATALGLFAAIPAVIAYNRYSAEVERMVNRYDAFLEEFSGILSRQAHQ